jgi:hypothetical protein
MWDITYGIYELFPVIKKMVTEPHPQQHQLSYILATMESKFQNMFGCSLFGPCQEPGEWQNTDMKVINYIHIFSEIITFHQVRLTTQNMIMGRAAPGTKNGCAGEGQQQFTRTPKLKHLIYLCVFILVRWNGPFIRLHKNSYPHDVWVHRHGTQSVSTSRFGTSTRYSICIHITFGYIDMVLNL